MKHLALILLMMPIIGIAQTQEEYLAKAQNYLKLDKYKEARSTLIKALESYPDCIECAVGRAELDFELKDYEDALVYLGVFIRKHPRESRPYDTRAVLHAQMSHKVEALEDINTALDLEKNDSIYHVYLANRGMINSMFLNYQEAYEDMSKVNKFNPDDIAVLVNLGVLCSQLNKFEEGIRLLEHGIELKPEFEAFYANLGYLYQEMGQYAKAITYYDKVVEMDPDQPLGYSNRSYNRMKMGDLKGAKQDIEKSLKIYPENSYAYKVRALIYLADGKNKKACEDLKTALERGYAINYGTEVNELLEKHCQ